MSFTNDCQYVICIGNVADGFELIGPFNDMCDLIDYAELHKMKYDAIMLQKPCL